jgi:predicted acylesterase/phospholipase RssA
MTTINGELRRALILAGGGMKVAFQAGVLQVLLDEAHVDFFMADGASGGVFNLAMWCQGMSGTEIADNWRNHRPVRGTQPNWWQLRRVLYAESVLKLDRFRTRVLPAWRLDFDKIRASERLATFNLFNFTRQRLETVTADGMTEDHLMAAVALPIWFPPVTIGGDQYIDGVFATDANLEEAIRRGADELWVIWTVSRLGEVRPGFIAQYFQMIEAIANSNLDAMRRRITANNAARERGESGEFGRRIELRLLECEVPVHYLIGFGRDRFAEVVELGVAKAREWCVAQGLTLGVPAPPSPREVLLTLSFDEQMKGRLAGSRALLDLTIAVADVDRFVTDPGHVAAVHGHLDCPGLGGRLTVARGTFNVLVDAGSPAAKQMVYDLDLLTPDGRPMTLRAVKDIVDDPGADLWRDTTRAHARVYEGWPPAGEPIAVGTVRVYLLDFLHQLTTFRVRGGTLSQQVGALTRFGRLFLGKLWDVYARDVLSQAPF